MFYLIDGSTLVAECLITEYNTNKEARDYKNRTPLFLAAELSKHLPNNQK